MRDASMCVPRPSTLVAEWRGEMNANDSLASHYNGTTVGNVTYTAGKHGMAFLFDGSSAYVTIDDSDALWPAASFSLEAWVNTTHPGGTLLEKLSVLELLPERLGDGPVGHRSQQRRLGRLRSALRHEPDDRLGHRLAAPDRRRPVAPARGRARRGRVQDAALRRRRARGHRQPRRRE
jgi:hypothetical protein